MLGTDAKILPQNRRREGVNHKRRSLKGNEMYMKKGTEVVFLLTLRLMFRFKADWAAEHIPEGLGR